MNEPHFTVKAFTNPSGGIVWRLDGVTREGKRIRKNYESHGEAKAK